MQSLTLNFQNQQIFENVLWLLKHFEEDGLEIIVDDDCLEKFDEAFDNGEDISECVDWSASRRPNLEQKWVNLDLPVWMIERLDYEAKRLGVARQAIMKMFLAQHLKKAG